MLSARPRAPCSVSGKAVTVAPQSKRIVKNQHPKIAQRTQVVAQAVDLELSALTAVGPLDGRYAAKVSEYSD